MTLPCARCGRAAVEITLLPATGKSKELWHDRDRLERTDFLDKVIRFGRYEQMLDLFEAIRLGDYATARQLDPDFVGFVCKVCEQVYCDTCWQIGSPPSEAEIYEYASGVCPLGHEQIVGG
jgi:hypothetical protein